MKYSALAISTLLASAFARPDINTNSRVHARDVHAQRGAYARPVWNAQLRRREVPQEHSHEKFLRAVRASLDLNNPDGILDSVFGLLGNAAGSAGQGSITDTGMSPGTHSRTLLLTVQIACNKLPPIKLSPTPKLPEMLMA